MTNTSSDTCAIGYNLFLTYANNGGSISRERINASLERRGRQGISARTFTHFQKLHRHGYDHYIPINQLDVATSQGAPDQ